MSAACGDAPWRISPAVFSPCASDFNDLQNSLTCAILLVTAFKRESTQCQRNRKSCRNQTARAASFTITTNTMRNILARCALTRTRCEDFSHARPPPAPITAFTMNIRAFSVRFNKYKRSFLRKLPKTPYFFEKILILACEKTREKQSLLFLNCFFEKKFKKSIDNTRFLCYNMEA